MLETVVKRKDAGHLAKAAGEKRSSVTSGMIERAGAVGDGRSSDRRKTGLDQGAQSPGAVAKPLAEDKHKPVYCSILLGHDETSGDSSGSDSKLTNLGQANSATASASGGSHFGIPEPHPLGARRESNGQPTDRCNDDTAGSPATYKPHTRTRTQRMKLFHPLAPYRNDGESPEVLDLNHAAHAMRVSQAQDRLEAEDGQAMLRMSPPVYHAGENNTNERKWSSIVEPRAEAFQRPLNYSTPVLEYTPDTTLSKKPSNETQNCRITSKGRTSTGTLLSADDHPHADHTTTGNEQNKPRADPLTTDAGITSGGSRRIMADSTTFMRGANGILPSIARGGGPAGPRMRPATPIPRRTALLAPSSSPSVDQESVDSHKDATLVGTRNSRQLLFGTETSEVEGSIAKCAKPDAQQADDEARNLTTRPKVVPEGFNTSPDSAPTLSAHQKHVSVDMGITSLGQQTGGKRPTVATMTPGSPPETLNDSFSRCSYKSRNTSHRQQLSSASSHPSASCASQGGHFTPLLSPALAPEGSSSPDLSLVLDCTPLQTKVPKTQALPLKTHSPTPIAMAYSPRTRKVIMRRKRLDLKLPQAIALTAMDAPAEAVLRPAGRVDYTDVLCWIDTFLALESARKDRIFVSTLDETRAIFSAFSPHTPRTAWTALIPIQRKHIYDPVELAAFSDKDPEIIA